MILSSLWYHSGILDFYVSKFIADFRVIIMASFGCQIGLCRQFTYWTVFPPTAVYAIFQQILTSGPSQLIPFHATVYTHFILVFTIILLREQLIKGGPVCKREDSFI